jgi:hypothetical protein
MTAAMCVLLAVFQSVLPAKNRESTILLTCFLLSVATGATCLVVLWNPDVHTYALFDAVL